MVYGLCIISSIFLTIMALVFRRPTWWCVDVCSHIHNCGACWVHVQHMGKHQSTRSLALNRLSVGLVQHTLQHKHIMM